MTFSTWAPIARSVELVFVDGRRVALERDESDERGRWHAEVAVEDLARGYRLSLDGGEPRPDPRSRWQPDGPHGASRWVDPATLHRRHAKDFRPAPLTDAVIYELHVGTFTREGTYAAAQTKLQHLAALGVTHLELMPLATFPGRHGWGYDGVHWFAPHPAYGTPEELAAFVSAAHGHGLGVLLDVVYNHFGPDGNYAPLFGPVLTERWKTPWGAAINYDGPHSDAVRAFAIENALMWLRDYGFDGLRLDAVHSIFDPSAVHVLEELATRVAALERETGRAFVLIAESDLNDPRFVRPIEAGGYGLHAHWCDDFHHALHAFLTGERDGYYEDFGALEQVVTALRDGYVFQGEYSPHRKRRHGRAPAGVRPEQLVVCAQNHDQIGNRARGERLSVLLPPEKLRAAAALTLLSPFTPLLFGGEEWGARTPFLYFTDHVDPQLARAVTEGRRKEFAAFAWQGDVPDPQAAETFAASKLRWEEAAEPAHAAMLTWYRRLIEIRRKHLTPYRDEGHEVRGDAGEGWLSWRCGRVWAACNFSAELRDVAVPPGKWRVVLAEPPLPMVDVALPAGSTVVCVRDNE